MASQLDMSLDEIIMQTRKNVMPDNTKGPSRNTFRKPKIIQKNNFTPNNGNVNTSNNGRFMRFRDRQGFRRNNAKPKLGFSNQKNNNFLPNTPNKKNPRRNNMLRISNLDYSIMQEDLMELFSSIGEVVKVWINYDRTDRSEGTGGCIFRNARDVQRAIETFNGRRIEGVAINLEAANPQVTMTNAPEKCPW